MRGRGLRASEGRVSRCGAFLLNRVGQFCVPRWVSFWPVGPPAARRRATIAAELDDTELAGEVERRAAVPVANRRDWALMRTATVLARQGRGVYRRALPAWRDQRCGTRQGTRRAASECGARAPNLSLQSTRRLGRPSEAQDTLGAWMAAHASCSRSWNEAPLSSTAVGSASFCREEGAGSRAVAGVGAATALAAVSWLMKTTKVGSLGSLR